MEENMQGIRNLNLDLPSQVEYNRVKNVTQDGQIDAINSQLAQLLAQNPAGFLPRVYYGLTRGNMTYRFTADTELTVELTGSLGDAFELYSNNESDDSYIAAVAVKKDDSTAKIIIQGDYTQDSSSFNAVNMTTGSVETITLSDVLSLQDGSSLSDYPAANNKEKQITVLHNVETNSNNVIFASLDLNSDDIYNWIEIGNFVDGIDGKSIYSVNSTSYSVVISNLRIGDSLVATEAFTYGNYTFAIGDVYTVSALSPFTLTSNGNIRGPRGNTGPAGTSLTVSNQDPGLITAKTGDSWLNYTTWDYFVYSTSAFVKVGNIKGADGTNGTNGADGQDGVDGQSFQMQSGLYSTPDNWGQSGNVDPDGNSLSQLPTLPQTAITGKGYVVYDPLTTPLSPFYDLYFANNGDNAWTIIHPFSGIAGQDGTDGQTPYISGGTWWIGSTNTGVAATGPQGPQGPQGPVGATFTYNAVTGVLSITT